MINPGSPVPVAVNIPARALGQPWRWLRLTSIPAGAVVSLRTVQAGNVSSFFTLALGEWCEMGDAVIDLFFTSTVAGTINYQWSLTDKIKTGGGGTLSGAVTITNIPLPVQGAVASGTAAVGFAPFGNALTEGHLNDIGGGSFELWPNMGNRVHNFATGKNISDGFFHTVPDTITASTSEATRTIRIVIAPGGVGAANLVFAFGVGTPKLFREDGTFYSNGIIPPTVVAGDAFLIPIVGSSTITITSASPLWAYGVGYSPDYCLPSSDVHPARLFARIEGALGAGDTLIVAGVAGQKIRVFSYNFSVAAGGPAADVVLRSGVTPISAKGYGVLTGSEASDPLFETAGGAALNFNLSAAKTASCQVSYELVPV